MFQEGCLEQTQGLITDEGVGLLGKGLMKGAFRGGFGGWRGAGELQVGLGRSCVERSGWAEL